MDDATSQALRNWLPATAGMVCLGFGAGLVGIFGFFVDSLSKEFAVGVATLNIAPVALLLVPGFVAPIVGKLVDRTPARRLILLGCTISMCSLMLASQAPTLTLAGLCFLGFALGITMYGPVVINGLMVKTYPGREGRALAIAAIGISVASAVLPPLVGLLLASMDWRSALFILAATLLVILWIVVLAAIPASAGGAAAAASERDPQLFGQREFWLVGITVALAFNVSMVLAICYPPLFVSRGFSAVEAGLFLSVAGVAGLTGKAVIALVADQWRAHARLQVAALLLFQFVGLLLLLQVESKVAIFACMLLLGFGGGAFIPMHAYLNSRYYEASMIGRVNGAQMPLFLPLGLVGPPLAGYVFDQSGSYQWVLVGLSVALASAIAVVLSLPRPRW